MRRVNHNGRRLFVEALENRLAPAAADLDLTLDLDGRMVTPVPGDEPARAVLVQPDGRIVVVGERLVGVPDIVGPPIEVSPDTFLARYNPDGTLDPTFGSDGFVETDFGFAAFPTAPVAGRSDGAAAAVLQPDGKIVVAGYVGAVRLLARYNPDGTLDSTFGGGDGFTHGPEAPASGVAYWDGSTPGTMADDKIVVAGGGSNRFHVARYNLNGTPDASFALAGETGELFDIPLVLPPARATSVAVLPDGRIVAAGSTLRPFSIEPAAFAVARLLPDGNPDPSFDIDGRAVTPFGRNAFGADLALLPDGRIVVAGITAGVGPTGEASGIALARYLPDGSLDSTFGGNFGSGQSFADVGSQEGVEAVAVQENGRIVVVGQVARRFAVVRFEPDGTPDTSFSPTGLVQTDFPAGQWPGLPFGYTAPENPIATGVVVLPDGRILAAGHGRVKYPADTQGTPIAPPRLEFLLARYDGDPVTPANAPPTAAAGGPYTVVEGDSLTLDASGSADPDGDALTFTWDVNGDGTFGDATGVSPVLGWAALAALGIHDGPGTFSPVRVRADDGHGHAVESAPVTLVVTNAPPAAGVTGPGVAVPGWAVQLTVTVADPSPADQAAGFAYGIDWDGNGTVDETVPAAPGNGGGVTLSHVYPATGVYTVHVTATDKDAGVSAAASTTIDVRRAALLNDPLAPGLFALVVGGTSGNDIILLTPGPAPGDVTVSVNGTSEGTFQPNSRLIVYAGAGNDGVWVHPSLTRPAWLYGGPGNDALAGGTFQNVLVGGDGTDLLSGLGARDILIGGTGSDLLSGGGRDDLLIAGTTAFDGTEAALAAIQAEWLSARGYADRLANVRGVPNSTFAFRRNGDAFLLADGASRTVFDDGVTDILLGGGGMDAYFVNLDPTGLDLVLGLDSGEERIDID